MCEVANSPIFDGAVNVRRISADDNLIARWSRSPAISTLSLGASWDATGSRVTLLSHASSAAKTGSGNDVTPSTTSDFRCLPPELQTTPSTEGNATSSGNEAEETETFSSERKRKWKSGLGAGPSNPISWQQPYLPLDDDDE